MITPLISNQPDECFCSYYAITVTAVYSSRNLTVNEINEITKQMDQVSDRLTG